MPTFVYRGSMIDARAIKLPSGGFAAKLIVASPGGRLQLAMLAGHWNTRETAEQAAFARGQQAIDGDDAGAGRGEG